MARLPGFAALHPFTPDVACQGALGLMHTLGEWLKDISGMDAITLQPAAGAQGEMTGIFLIAAYHRARGDAARTTVIIPDSAHGTNPATAALAGFVVQAIKSDARGQMDLGALQAALGPQTAALMLTLPNTVGRFETEVTEIARLVHEAGALLYIDGANMNALMGVVRPGDCGADAMHFNLHKTFSTPHGGGGPGSGPVAVKKHLEPFLPVPVIAKEGGRYVRQWDRPQSIGKLHGYSGNFGMHVRAYTYIAMLGREGIRQTAQAAVLNANYLAARIEGTYPMPYGRGMHECVATGTPFKDRYGVKTLDIAKRLLDYGFHAPTVYFPLIVHEALMIEPTETATRDELDRFADTMLQIAKEAAEQPELVTGAPRLTPVSRFDEAAAARHPDVRYGFDAEREAGVKEK
jgi:glycine cleavage system P protein (glycine dehydrogenase) subunit 2